MEVLVLRIDLGAFAISRIDASRDDSRDAEWLDGLGTRIHELSARIASEQRAEFERDVVEPYRRLRQQLAPR